MIRDLACLAIGFGIGYWFYKERKGYKGNFDVNKAEENLRMFIANNWNVEGKEHIIDEEVDAILYGKGIGKVENNTPSQPEQEQMQTQPQQKPNSNGTASQNFQKQMEGMAGTA